MKLLFIILCTFFQTYVRFIKPNARRAVVAEILLLKTQLLIARRKLSQCPPLTPVQKLIFALAPFFISAKKFSRSCFILKPVTVLKFHRLLVHRTYSRLYRNRHSKMGRPSTPKEIRELILEIKNNNPTFGCPQIAAIIKDRTGVSVSDETVRKILLKYYHGAPGEGPSWLTFLATQKDSLWSLDLFRAESILLKSYWVMVVMDQWSRKIIGFSVTCGNVDGHCLCAMFNSIVSSHTYPKRLSHDHDPLFHFGQWTRNLTIMEIDEIWTVANVPWSHPFVERLIGSIRRGLLDRILFWNGADLLRKLSHYQDYFNEARVHSGIGGNIPQNQYVSLCSKKAKPQDLIWKKYCHGLFNVPMVA